MKLATWLIGLGLTLAVAGCTTTGPRESAITPLATGTPTAVAEVILKFTRHEHKVEVHKFMARDEEAQTQVSGEFLNPTTYILKSVRIGYRPEATGSESSSAPLPGEFVPIANLGDVQPGESKPFKTRVDRPAGEPFKGLDVEFEVGPPAAPSGSTPAPGTPATPEGTSATPGGGSATPDGTPSTPASGSATP